MREKNLALMDDILSGIDQSEEWANIQLHDPMIKAEEKRFADAIDCVDGIISDKQYSELSDAAANWATACGNAGILYGMHVAFAIMDVVGNIPDMSRHIMERIRRETA